MRAPPVLLALVLAHSAAAAPLVDLWPTKVIPREDGRVTYVYSLEAAKKGAVQHAEDPEKAREFLKALPGEVRVLATLRDVTYSLTATGPLSPGPLAPSFSDVKPPRGAKLLPSADALLWKGERALDGLTAGILLAVEEGKWGFPMSGKQFWSELLEKAEARTREGAADQREGAMLLAARLGAALCSGQKLSARVGGNEELAKAIEVERKAGRVSSLPMLPSEMDGWTSALDCLARREQRLGLALPASRAGVAAALQLLSILESEPKLGKMYANLSELRDALSGSEPVDALARYRQLLVGGSATKTLQELPAFIDKLAKDGVRFDDGLHGPAIFVRSRTPVQRFVAQLEGQERVNALEEIAVAATDGRLSLEPKGDAPPDVWRSAALAPLLQPRLPGAPEALNADHEYRARLLHAFRALQGAPAEFPTQLTDVGDLDAESGKAELKVRLNVPPSLDLEPVPEAYARMSRAFSRIQAVLQTSKRGVHGITPTGAKRSQPAGVEAARLQILYRGLSHFAHRAVGVTPQKERDEIAVEAALNFLEGWQRDPDLRQDSRWVLPRSGGSSDERLVGGVFGIGMRTIGVKFEDAPKLELETSVDEEDVFELEAEATQRYLVPVLVSGAVPSEKNIDRAGFRKLADRSGRDLQKIQAALAE